MNLLQKLIYIWLIFCLGAVGPLVYFDGFMPGHEHGDHPFHVSIFEEAPHVHHPLPPHQETLVERSERFSQLDPHLPSLIVTQALASGFARFFTSGLSKGYILTAAPLKILNLPSLFHPVGALSITGQSLPLAPLEKPPPVYLA